MIGTAELLASAGGTAIALSKLDPAREVLAERELLEGGGGPGGGGRFMCGAQ